MEIFSGGGHEIATVVFKILTTFDVWRIGGYVALTLEYEDATAT